MPLLGGSPEPSPSAALDDDDEPLLSIASEADGADDEPLLSADGPVGTDRLELELLLESCGLDDERLPDGSAEEDSSGPEELGQGGPL
jgi:hypothetical protein